MATPREVTVGPVSGTYGSLEAAEAAEQGDISASTGSDEYVVFLVEDFSDTARLGMGTGWKTEAPDNFILIKPDENCGHDGRAREVSGVGAEFPGMDLASPCSHVYVEDMVIKDPTTGGSSTGINLTVSTWDSGSIISLKRCVIHDKLSAPTTKYAINASEANLNFLAENCIIYGNQRPIDGRSAATCVLNHNVFFGGSALGPILDSSCEANNNYSGGHTSEDWWTGGSAPGGDYNASEDASAETDYTNGIGSLTASDQFNNASIGTSADFRLKAGADLIDAGGTGVGVTDDIEGNTRDASPDIGASEYVTAGGGVTGAAAIALSSLVPAAAGTVTPPSFDGVVSVDLSSLAVAAAGAASPPGFSGAAAIDLSSLAPQMSGTVTPPVFAGAVAQVLSSLLVNLSGTHVPPGISGSASIPLSSLVAAAAGTVSPPVFAGTVAQVLSSLVAAAAGTHNAPGSSGQIAVDLSPLGVAAAGTVVSPGIVGQAAITLSSLLVAAAGTSEPPVFSGAIAATLASLVVNAAGSHVAPGTSGAIALALSSLQVGASGTFSIPSRTGAIDIELASLIPSLIGDAVPPPRVGAIAITLSPLEVAAYGSLGLLVTAEGRRLLLAAAERSLLLDPAERDLLL